MTKADFFDRKRDRLRSRALAKRVKFSLSKSELKKLFAEETCPCCHRTMTRINNDGLELSIDRLVPAYGYTEDNVVAICRTCNNKKADMSYDELVLAGETEIASWVKSASQIRGFAFTGNSISRRFLTWLGNVIVNVGISIKGIR